ncbi:cyclic nucleotide-gated cation channel alpha-4 [Pyrgilauda ruficollis]|uniref:cyclic nucleotide-gated cation channel alpha-4 n=1 Tax=Pyrgilauda ruficollis TaxID=221976 RepID=UPI001B8756FF|nr:cyclic nucleotide-gated cation channel alpha-4 [Pyrgilauda ruficollis]
MPRGRAAYLGQGRGGPVPSAPHLRRAEEASGAGSGPPGGTGPLALGTAARPDPSPPRPLTPTAPGPGRSLRPRAAKGGRRPGQPGTAAEGRLDLPRGGPRAPDAIFPPRPTHRARWPRPPRPGTPTAARGHAHRGTGIRPHASAVSGAGPGRVGTGYRDRRYRDRRYRVPCTSTPGGGILRNREPLCAGQRRAATPRSWSLDPAGDWHYRWISLMVLPILYNWVVLILRCCFPEVQEAHAGLWQALDGLSDALYLLDIAVHLHTGFLEDGILVQDVSRTRRRYLASWTFPWDVMAVLPTELLCLLPGVPRVPGVPAARANRCLRVPRLFEAFDRCETRTAWPNVFRMAKLMLYLLLGIHWHGCLYLALSARLGLGADPWVCPSFTRLLRRYLHSFYFSTLVLAMVGDTPEPQREEELLFLTAGFLLAVLGFATITGSISTVIVNLSSSATAFYPDAGPVRRYLRARGVDGRLAGRVVRWHQHLRAQRKLPAEWDALQHLPRGLRAEVAAGVHLAALRRVGLFRGWEHGVLRQLVLRLRPQVFGPGEFVCRRGDVGREMYFIREGRLAVVAEDGVTQLAVLGEGLYFGEISLINIKGNMAGNRRTANILSIGYSDLFCLGKEDLAEVLAEFPRARAAMEAKGRELLLRMGQLDTAAEAAALAAGAEAERRLQGLEVALEGLQTRAARLLAQLEASALRMALRVRRLEGRLQLRDRAGQGAPRAQGPAREPGSAGGQGPTGVQGPSKAQGPHRAQGPSDMQGAPKAQDSPMVQGPLRARGPRGVPAGPSPSRRDAVTDTAMVAVARCLKSVPSEPPQAARPARDSGGTARPGTPRAPLPVLSVAPPGPHRPGLPPPPPPPPAPGPPRAGRRPRLSTGGSERIGASSLPEPPGA